MQLKPFELGQYDDEHVVIYNPENRKQELLTIEEFEVVKFLKQNESETLLALLLPNIGIAKKSHIKICVAVLAKLKKLQILDVNTITGRKIESDTATLELELDKKKIEIAGLDAFSALCFGVFARLIRWGGPGLIIFLAAILSTVGLLYFPYEDLNEGAFIVFSYSHLFICIYLAATVAIWMRSLFQGALVESLGRSTIKHRFSFYWGFVFPTADFREVQLEGVRSRVLLSLVGILASLSTLVIPVGLLQLDVLSLQNVYFCVAGISFATLIFAAPFLPFDGATFIHTLFVRNKLSESISSGLRQIFKTKGSLSKEMLIGILVSFIWLLAWLDFTRMFWDVLSEKVVTDLTGQEDLTLQVMASVVVFLLLSALVFPAMVFVVGFLRDQTFFRKNKVVVEKGKEKDSLSFEERMSALEKIPLFSYLNDQERLALLNEMNPRYYASGEYLVHQGEVGSEFYVLVKGIANAYYAEPAGKTHFLADLGEGDAFGEIALIDDVPRTASIISDGGCIVLVLNKDGFDRFAESMGSPDRVKAMIRLTSFFRRHPLFSKLRAIEQAQLIDTFRFQFFKDGEYIQAAANSEEFLVVYSGGVKVDLGDDASDTTLEADDCFGYANGMNASFQSSGGTGLLAVGKVDFHNLIWEKLVSRPELFL
ncbi:MAG: cyclic nucleotide-binding domain-containing protein [Oligoflexia bacterium]|nr:cyclic nucleotide-binding domain-containing protein [Oligoflexia bacterium]